jgi:hypothetical protein
MVPKITLITSGLLMMAILLNLANNSYNKSKKIFTDFSSILLPMISIGLLSTWILIRSWGNDGQFIYADINLIILQTLFLFFILVTQKDLSSYLKTYVYFVLIMALCGIIAYALFVFNIIDQSDHFVSIYDLTNGSFTRDKFLDNSYIFPYGLGFILMADGQLELLGYEFYRISGWAHEPTSASLFTVPALLLLLHKKLFIKRRRIMLIIIAIFLLLIMSVGSMVALLVLFTAMSLVYSYTKIFDKDRILKALLFCLIVSAIVFVIYYDRILESTLLGSKFDMESNTMNVALRELLWFIPQSNKTSIYYFSHMAVWAIIALFFIVSIIRLIENDKNIYSLIMIYIIVHSMKGSQLTVYYLVFTFFWFYMVHFSNKLILDGDDYGEK